MAELSATASLQEGRIDVSFRRSGPAPRADLAIVRRRGTPPQGFVDGRTVFDLTDLMGPAASADADATARAPWARIERTRYLVVNSHAEAGLCQAEVSRYFDGPGPTPKRIVIATYSAATGGMTLVPFDGAEVADGETQPITVEHDIVETQITRTTSDPSTPPGELRFTAVTRLGTTLDSPVLRSATFEETLDPDSGEWGQTLSIADMEPAGRSRGPATTGLEPGTELHYLAFHPRPIGGTILGLASAIATGPHGYGDRLYAMLPAVHRYHDAAIPPGGGSPRPLQRFLEPFGRALDQIQSLAEGLSTRHDVSRARAEDLSHLARWIGWESDTTLPAALQRNDIRFAPEVFETIGTLPGLRALIQRETGWDCQIRELVGSLFWTNAKDPVRLWEIWQAIDVGAGFGVPEQVTDLPLSPPPPPEPEVPAGPEDPNAISPEAPILPGPGPGPGPFPGPGPGPGPVLPPRPPPPTRWFDGRPSPVLVQSVVWLFWHSKQGDRPRRIFVERLNQPDTHPEPATDARPEDAFDEESPAAVTEGSGARLFWASNRDGRWNLWTKLVPSSDAATRVFDHPAEDRAPAAVRAKDERLHLFWHSNRRGRLDVWTATLNAGKWSPPSRVTPVTEDADAPALRSHSPAAVRDGADTIHLFWTDDLGATSILRHAALVAGAFVSQPLPDNLFRGRWRDESPAAVCLDPSRPDGRLRLFWHSDRGGHWRLWSSELAAGVWSAPTPVLQRLSSDKDPAALIDAAGALRLFWRSEVNAEPYRSVTVDTDRAHTWKPFMGTARDPLHYTYDTARAQGVAVHFDQPNTRENRDVVARVRAFVEPFRPVQVRLHWFLRDIAV